MSYQCRPGRVRWLSLIVMLCALLPFVLARWQWQRGQSREAALVAFDAASKHPAIPFLSLRNDLLPDYRRVRVSGVPAGEPLLLTNAYRGTEPGVRVLEPFKLADGSVLLVEQGWLARGKLKTRLTAPPPALIGRWVPLPQRFTLSDAHIVAQGPTDAIDLALLVRRFNMPVRNGLVVAEAVPAPLEPWPVRPPFEPARNYGYAVQWLLIGFAMLGGGAVAWRKRNERS